MKNIKRIISIFLCVLMLIPFTALMGSAAGTHDRTLQFNKDGKFKILNISDVQDGHPLNSATKRFIAETLDQVQPDLVILTGDNIAGYSATTKLIAKLAIRDYMQIFEDRHVKVAAVYGNHDAEKTTATKAFQLEVYNEFDCFIGEAGYVEGNTMCTYNLPIKSSDGKRNAFNLWLIDSGMYNTENDRGGYACVTKGQIEWYKQKAAELAAENGGKYVPSINFQHIIVPEIFDALKKVPEGTPGSYGRYNYDLEQNFFYVLPAGAKGELLESPCPPSYTNGQFDAMLDTGDVLATVSGHDHVNTFEVMHKGINIINTPSMGFASYDGRTIGARVFMLDENNPENYETYVLGYHDIFSPDDKLAMSGYLFFSDTSSAKTKFVNFFRYSFYYVKDKFDSLFDGC